MKNISFSNSPILVYLSFLVLGFTIFIIGTEVGKNGQSAVANVENETTETTETIALTIDADDDAFMGKEDAPIEMIEFSDYQCPYCRKFFNETLPSIKEDYIDKGLVKFVYRDLPLVGLGHTGAIPAANAAECARAQGGDEMYFAYHDKIFKGQNELGFGTVPIPSESLYQYAEELGLDSDEFYDCQENLEYESEIQNDLKVAESNGLNGTPSFIINGQLITGAYPYETFKSFFDDILN